MAVHQVMLTGSAALAESPWGGSPGNQAAFLCLDTGGMLRVGQDPGSIPGGFAPRPGGAGMLGRSPWPLRDRLGVSRAPAGLMWGETPGFRWFSCARLSYF